METNLDRQLHASDYGKDLKDRQVIEAKINKEYKIVGSIQHVTGWTLFEINQKTLEIKEAVFREQSTAHYTTGEAIPKRVDMKQHHYYMEALNKKYAMNKYLKLCGIVSSDEQYIALVSMELDPKNLLTKKIYKSALKKMKIN